MGASERPSLTEEVTDYTGILPFVTVSFVAMMHWFMIQLLPERFSRLMLETDAPKATPVPSGSSSGVTTGEDMVRDAAWQESCSLVFSVSRI